MSFSDTVLISGGSIIGWLVAFVVLAIVYVVLMNWLDEEEQVWIKLCTLGVAVCMLMAMAFSFITTQYVHTSRTTIDRSVGDQSQQELQEQVEQGEDR